MIPTAFLTRFSTSLGTPEPIMSAIPVPDVVRADSIALAFLAVKLLLATMASIGVVYPKALFAGRLQLDR